MAKSEEKIIDNKNIDTYQDASGNIQNIDNISNLSSDVASVAVNSDETSTQNISESENVGVNINETSTPDNTAVKPEPNIEPQKNNFDFMMRNFKRESSGKVAEVRRREAYVPPSLKRKEKSENARRRKHRSY